MEQMSQYSEKSRNYVDFTDMELAMLRRERERIRMYKEELDIPGLFRVLLEEHRISEKKLAEYWLINAVTVLGVVFFLCVAYAHLVHGK